MGHLSLRDLYDGKLEAGLLYWYPEGYAKSLWKWATVSIKVALLGNMEGLSFPRAFERTEKNSLFREIFMKNLRDI